MLVPLVGLNDARVLVNPRHISMVSAGPEHGTTRIKVCGDDAIIVQGFLADVEPLFKRRRGWLGWTRP